MCDRSSALLKLGSTPGDKDESTFDSDDAARSACDKRRRGRRFVMRNGGVALYGKNVYVAMLNGEVVALDAQTGSPAWRKAMFEPGVGYAFSLAPLALDGALVVGSAGGEYGARGFIAALNPDNGNVLW